MALMKLNLTVLLMVLMLGNQATIRAGTLRKVWQLDLRQIIRGAPSANANNLPVQLIRFSPEGQQLAVAVAWDMSRNVFKSRLLVIDLQHVDGAAKQFEISAGVGNEEMPGPGLFGWSPNGEVVFAAGKVIHLQQGTTCELPGGRTALINNNLLILNQPDPVDGEAVRAQMDAIQKTLKESGGRPIAFSKIPSGPPERKSHFRFFDSECQSQGEEWQVAEKWDIHDVSTERGLLAITRNVGFLKNEFLIVDPLAKAIVRRWPPGSGIGGQFAQGGRAVCNGGDVEETGSAPVTCWDVDRGEKIGESPTVNGGAPMTTSAHSSRIVASDYQRVKDPLSSYEYAKLLKRRVVWDFRSNKELASWRPEFQSDINAINGQWEDLFQFAISPDGQYVADGGNGIIRLFKIEP